VHSARVRDAGRTRPHGTSEDAAPAGACQRRPGSPRWRREVRDGAGPLAGCSATSAPVPSGHLALPAFSVLVLVVQVRREGPDLKHKQGFSSVMADLEWQGRGHPLRLAPMCSKRIDHSLDACFSLLARATVGPHCVASSSLVPARLQPECGSGRSALRLLQRPTICDAVHELRVRTLARRGRAGQRFAGVPEDRTHMHRKRSAGGGVQRSPPAPSGAWALQLSLAAQGTLCQMQR
jgi:hypothetical protein